MARPAVGLWDDITSHLQARLHDAGIRLHYARHRWDETLYPHATVGYFKFKKALPEAITTA